MLWICIYQPQFFDWIIDILTVLQASPYFFISVGRGASKIKGPDVVFCTKYKNTSLGTPESTQVGYPRITVVKNFCFRRLGGERVRLSPPTPPREKIPAYSTPMKISRALCKKALCTLFGEIELLALSAPYVIKEKPCKRRTCRSSQITRFQIRLALSAQLSYARKHYLADSSMSNKLHRAKCTMCHIVRFAITWRYVVNYHVADSALLRTSKYALRECKEFRKRFYTSCLLPNSKESFIRYSALKAICKRLFRGGAITREHYCAITREHYRNQFFRDKTGKKNSF